MGFGDFHTLILAGGNSSRMGFPKGLISHQDTSLLLGHLRAHFKHSKSPAIVVSGIHYAEYQREIDQAPGRVLHLHNPFPQSEAFDSLLLALSIRKLRDFFVTPVDKTPLSDELLGWFKRQNPAHPVLMPRFEGRGGHPLFFREGMQAWILERASEGSHRLDLLIRELGRKVLRFETPCGEITQNFNLPSDIKPN